MYANFRKIPTVFVKHFFLVFSLVVFKRSLLFSTFLSSLIAFRQEWNFFLSTLSVPALETAFFLKTFFRCWSSVRVLLGWEIKPFEWCFSPQQKVLCFLPEILYEEWGAGLIMFLNLAGSVHLDIWWWRGDSLCFSDESSTDKYSLLIDGARCFKSVTRERRRFAIFLCLC